MQGPSNALVVPVQAWVLFGAVVLISLGVDLLAHRGRRSESKGHAIAWSIGWIAVALLFALWVGLRFGSDHAHDFVTAYLIEKSLSIDTLFVFLLIFARLGIPKAQQHRVLFWGIIGALVARGVLIALGSALLARFHDYVVYPLGVFLLLTGWKTARAKDQHGDGRIVEFFRRRLRMTDRFADHRFFTRENGRRVATPLFLALVAIEATDLLFAVDSVPAVFAISEEPFIVYSSNVFAVLGLRALYLVLASLLRDLRYLRHGLAAIIVFAGAKMLTAHLFHVPHLVSLLVIVAILTTSIVASVIARRRSPVEASANP